MEGRKGPWLVEAETTWWSAQENKNVKKNEKQLMLFVAAAAFRQDVL